MRYLGEKRKGEEQGRCDDVGRRIKRDPTEHVCVEDDVLTMQGKEKKTLGLEVWVEGLKVWWGLGDLVGGLGVMNNWTTLIKEDDISKFGTLVLFILINSQ